MSRSNIDDPGPLQQRVCAVAEGEIDRLFAADLLILQFPMWWFSVPAILKGWIDRVFAFGVTYDFGRTWDKGVMCGRRAMLSMTTSAPPGVFMPDGRSGDLNRYAVFRGTGAAHDAANAAPREPRR